MIPEGPGAKAYLVTGGAEAPPVIHGDGEQTRDFTFVADVVSANLSAMACDAGPCDSPVFNVGSGTGISINELWNTVCAIVGASRAARHGEPRPGDVRHSVADISRGLRSLGYAPRFSIREGLEATIPSYLPSTIR